MSADAFGILAIIAYTLAIIAVAVAVAIFFTQHIRQVRDDLTGRTAQRAIAELRSGSTARSRFFGGGDAELAAAKKGAGKGAGKSQPDSGSLHLRIFKSRKTGRFTNGLGKEAPADAPLSPDTAESPTTLLSGAPEGVSAESATTLLDAESATTLLTNSGDAR